MKSTKVTLHLTKRQLQKYFLIIGEPQLKNCITLV